MGKKMCELCHEKPATVPDRNRTGQPINRLCYSCHAERLKGDLSRIAQRLRPHPSKEPE
jgi:predicted CXXCH cytochrome family protein